MQIIVIILCFAYLFTQKGKHAIDDVLSGNTKRENVIKYHPLSELPRSRVFADAANVKGVRALFEPLAQCEVDEAALFSDSSHQWQGRARALAVLRCDVQAALGTCRRRRSACSARTRQSRSWPTRCSKTASHSRSTLTQTCALARASVRRGSSERAPCSELR